MGQPHKNTYEKASKYVHSKCASIKITKTRIEWSRQKIAERAAQATA